VPWFARHAEVLFENGYEPLPLRPGQKVPAVSRWSQVGINADCLESWVRQHGHCGIGLRTGRLVGLDIDILEPDQAHSVMQLACDRLGYTLMRVGRWPKRLLLYRTETPFPKIVVKPLEVLGAGQQFVGFGMHPDTDRSYDWPLGETPLDVPLTDLPVVDHAQMLAFVAEARAIVPEMTAPTCGGGRGRKAARGGSAVIARDDAGRVIDGRDAWLSQIAFHVLHDAIAHGDDLDAMRLACTVWARFVDSTDLSRGRQDGGLSWAFSHALQKVQDKLRLHYRGDLPPRQRASVEANYEAPTQSAGEARQRLETEIAAFCSAVLSHHSDGLQGEPPRIGLRATTGLGKSTIARERLLDLRRKLTDIGAPNRLVWFTPSHALAEETAEAWRELGLTAAVLRGHERLHPVLKTPMCRDPEAIEAALNAGAVNRHPIVTPYRRPILTPLVVSWPGAA